MRVTLPDSSRAVAEVMATEADRAVGLMHRKSLPPGRFLVFHYANDGQHLVWMKDCHFPIDVAWLGADGQVQALARDLPPCTEEPCPIYGPEFDTRHFVEGNAGWLDAHGVALGGFITLGPVLPQRP